MTHAFIIPLSSASKCRQVYGIELTQIIKRAEKDIYKLAILTKVSIFIYANSLNTDDLILLYMC